MHDSGKRKREAVFWTLIPVFVVVLVVAAFSFGRPSSENDAISAGTAPAYSSKFVNESAPHDGDQMLVDNFTKDWLIQNTGNTIWDETVKPKVFYLQPGEDLERFRGADGQLDPVRLVGMPVTAKRPKDCAFRVEDLNMSGPVPGPIRPDQQARIRVRVETSKPGICFFLVRLVKDGKPVAPKQSGVWLLVQAKK